MKGSKIVIGIVVVVFLAVIGFGIFKAVKKNKPQQNGSGTAK